MRALPALRPINMIVMVNIIGFGLLFFYKKPYDPYILLAGLSAVLLIVLGSFTILKANLYPNIILSLC